METKLIEEMLKQSTLVGVLGFCGYILWKRYDKFTERTMNELDVLRAEVKRIMEEDRIKMYGIIETNTRSIDRQSLMMDRSAKVMECIIEEIKDFKEGELYQEHLGRRVKSIRK